MRAGGCNFPDHHSSGGGPVFGWAGALIVGAVIVTHWRAVAVVAAVVAALTVAGVIVLALWRSASSRPYDASWDGTEPQNAVQVTPVHQLSARVAELEERLANRQIEAPQQHLHIHTTPEVAGELARHLNGELSNGWNQEVLSLRPGQAGD